MGWGPWKSGKGMDALGPGAATWGRGHLTRAHSPCRAARAEDAAAPRGSCGHTPTPDVSRGGGEARPQSEPLAYGHGKQLVLIVIE